MFPHELGTSHTMSTKVHLTPSTYLSGIITHARGNSNPVHAFLGIPYAQPPVGTLRFQPPERVALWEGERSAKVYGR